MKNSTPLKPECESPKWQELKENFVLKLQLNLTDVELDKISRIDFFDSDGNVI